MHSEWLIMNTTRKWLVHKTTLIGSQIADFLTIYRANLEFNAQVATTQLRTASDEVFCTELVSWEHAACPLPGIKKRPLVGG